MEIEEVRVPIGHAQQHESAADVAGFWQHDREREPGGHCGVNGVSALTHHLDARLRCQLVSAGHHGVRRAHGRHVCGARRCGDDE